MPKTDYFTIVYKILAYLYDCFQEGTRADIAFYGAEALGINEGYWKNVIDALLAEGYIKGAEVIINLKDGIPIAQIERYLHTKITQSGIAFLLTDRMIAKARRALKKHAER